MIFYSHQAQAFFDDQIHSVAQIPDDAQTIDAQQHQALLDALNTGAHIGEDLSIVPRPSPAHTWNGKAWVVDKQKQAEAEQATFQAAQTAKLAELAQAAQAFVDLHAKTDIIPTFEQETWAMQGAEARTWADDDNAPTPILDSIAQHRGIDRIALIRAALRKTQQYETLAAGVAGQRQALQVQIENAKTSADLDKVTITFRLPEMGG